MVRSIALLLAMALLAASDGAQALPADRTLAQMIHTRWTTDDDAPSPIQALAQTRDGFLWIGSSAGLYRFDGLAFERVPIIGPESSVTALLATRDGRLFVGLQNGHLLLVTRGAQTDVTPSSRAKWVRRLVEDGAGGIWMQTISPDMALVRYYAGRWTRYGPSRGVPEDGFLKTTIAARDGSVWVLTQNLLLVLKPGRARFDVVAAALDDKIDGIVEDRSGDVWTADHQHGLKRVTATSASPTAAIAFADRANRFRSLYVDRGGDIWGNVTSSDLFRITSDVDGKRAPRIERYGPADGLTSGAVNAILEDREGTIWAGTSGGLDRFRPASVVLETAVAAKSDFGYGMIADRTGAIYITDRDTLYRVAPHGSPVKLVTHLNNPMTLCEGAGGDIWIAVTGAVERVRNGVVRTFPPPNGNDYMRCQSDKDGRPWFLTTMGELFRHGPAGWDRQLDNGRPMANRFAFDAEGRPLVFYENAGLARQTGAAMSMVWPVNRIPGGRAGASYLGAGGMMVGGVSGLARIRGDKVDLLDAGYPWLQHVTGIAETARGDTWLHTSLGIFELSTVALQRAFDHPGTALSARKFDARDGLRGANLLDYADNGSAVGGDGRVWFITAAGIVWIDPSRLVRNVVIPPVTITRVIADGSRWQAPMAVSLPAGARNLEIDYTALSLAVPERVQFRYQMNGIDAHWVNPGPRRQAFYQNLPPGSYAFTVIAANDNGVWNKQGATIRFTLPPTFVQSWTFKLLCVAAAGLVIWLVYRLRLRSITARLREQVETRVVERERIARELHDTLLQGVHGLILRFQGIADRLPREQVPGRLMEKALERAEELLIEGRERVHGLRSRPGHSDLRSALAEVIDQVVSSVDLDVVVRETGGARSVRAVARDEIVGIVREALSNVAKHAGATEVDVVIAYFRGRLAVSVADNGLWSQPMLGRETANRHFGIVGMRERAHRIGGTLKVQPGIDTGGTTVTVVLPARTAFFSSSGWRLREWWRPTSSASTA